MKNTGKYIIIVFSILLFFNKSIAQISRGGLPPSFKDKSISKDFKTVMIPELDLSTITGEDFNETNNGTLYKIARTIAVDLNPKKSGTWTYLPGGGKI